LTTLAIILADAVVFASVLFVISVGLTLIGGVLRILNLAHGAFYALGAYLATTLVMRLVASGVHPAWTYLALPVAAILVAVTIGPLVERVLLKRVYGSPEAIQLLLTFCVLVIVEDLIKLVWGTRPMFASEPYTLLGEMTVAGIRYSRYHAVLLGVAVTSGALLVWMMRATRIGKMIRVVIADREMSTAMGIDVNRVFTLAFTLGTFFAALGGALIAPTVAVAPGFAVEIGIVSFAVIAIGGMGSLEGAALGALIVGLTRASAIHLLPEAEFIGIYVIMVLVLLFKPEGLLGAVEVRRI
jgi:branched-chain amino acid transport system permease protein